MRRVLTGLVLAALAWALVFRFPPQAFFAAAVVLSGIALHEFFTIAEKGGVRPFVIAGHVGAILWLVVPNLDRGYFLTLFAVAVLGAGTLARLPFEEILPSAAATVVGILYVAGPLLCGILLHDFSPHWLFLIMLVIAVGDTAAFVIGRLFGRTKLAARTSPGKTWEGTLASALMGTGVGVAYASQFLSSDIGIVGASLLALATNVAGQIGDLAESALKRAASLKDSGTMLPGHGGVLDRIDGMLFAIPIGYGYVTLLA